MIIVLNGKATLRACVRNALMVCDRAVIVEGCIEAASGLNEGHHSTDGTLRVIEELKRDYKDRIVLVQQDGYWLEKLAMCQAAVPHFEPGWVWQIDADEFYFPDRMQELLRYLEGKEYTDVEFWAFHFFGGHEQHTSLVDTWGNHPPWRRLFRWDSGQQWQSHRPPRMDRPEALLDRDATASLGIYLYHYGYLWRRQLKEKTCLHGGKDRRLTAAWETVQAGRFAMINEQPVVPFTGKHPINPLAFEV